MLTPTARAQDEDATEEQSLRTALAQAGVTPERSQQLLDASVTDAIKQELTATTNEAVEVHGVRMRFL
jgi:phage baseplate assembly protein W